MMMTILQCIVPKVSATSLALLAMFASLVCGCNPDAFVDPIRPSARNFAIMEDGDSVTVRFKTDDWRVYSVRVNDNINWYLDLSSKPIETDDGKMKLTATGFTMFYKKSAERELSMFFQPNFSDTDLKVEIVIASSFEYDTLKVAQPRSSGYELERIEWNEPVARTFPEFEKGWGPMSCKNEGTDTLRVKMKAFAGAVRQVEFSDDSGFGLYCGDFKVPVPDGALDNEELCFSEQSTLTYSYDINGYPIDDDREVTLRFPPTGEFSRYYSILWNIDTYSTGYDMFLRNKATGKIVEIKGKFSSKSPNGVYTLYVEKR